MPPPKRRGRPRIYCSTRCQRNRVGIDRRYANQNSIVAVPPDELVEIHARYHREGWTRQQLADVYGVSTRTIDRYLSRSAPVLVEVGAWRAWFAVRLTGDTRPTRVSPWEPTPSQAESAVA